MMVTWLAGESVLLQRASGLLLCDSVPEDIKEWERDPASQSQCQDSTKRKQRSASSFKTSSRGTTWKGIIIPSLSRKACFKIHRMLVRHTQSCLFFAAQDTNPRGIYIPRVLCSWRNCTIFKIIKTHPLTFASIMRKGKWDIMLAFPVLIPKVICAAPPFMSDHSDGSVIGSAWFTFRGNRSLTQRGRFAFCPVKGCHTQGSY